MIYYIFSVIKITINTTCIVALIAQTIIANPQHSEIKETKNNIFQPISYHGTYKIELDKDSYFDIGIDSVNGTEELKIREENNQWKVQSQSRMYVHFKKDLDNDNNAPSQYDVEINSEENNDGLHYAFNCISTANHTQDQNHIQGELKFPVDGHNNVNLNEPPKIIKDKNKAYIQYTAPEFIRVNIDKDVIFPQKHLHFMIKSALKNIFTVHNQKYFDGSSENPEVVVVDTEIIPQDNFKMQTKLRLDEKDDTTTDGKTSKHNENASKLANLMQDARIWTLKMNFYPLGKRETTEPDYIVTQTVNSLGMILSMKIKYMEPEFTVNITMTDCKLLQPLA